MSTLKGMAASIHHDNRERGFYDDVNPSDTRHLISIVALVGTETAEMIEALRKPGKSQKIPRFTGEEEETADAIIRLLDYAGFRDLRIDAAITAKLKYNRRRGYRHGGKRA